MNTAPSPKSPWRIAHRGLHSHCVENTLEAFAAAYGKGCDMVEFDVQLSSDGVPMVFHDDDLRRLGNRPEAVYALTASELQSVPLCDPATLAVGRMPTLAEFLQLFGSQPFYLEIKVPEAKRYAPEYWQSLTRKSIGELSSGLSTSSPSGLSNGLRHPWTFAASFHPDAVRYALSELGFPRVASIHENLGTLRAALSAPNSDPLSLRLFDSVSYAVFREALCAGLNLRPDRLLLWNVAGPGQFCEARHAGVAGIVADNLLEEGVP